MTTVQTKTTPEARERAGNGCVVFVVAGQPIPKARPRVIEGGSTFTPKATKEWERAVGWSALASGVHVIPGNLAVTLNFRRKGKRRADLDNLCKAVLDGLNGVAYEDDYQVVSLSATVAYSSSKPGVTVEIRRVA